jgi:hypothetical protein
MKKKNLKSLFLSACNRAGRSDLHIYDLMFVFTKHFDVFLFLCFVWFPKFILFDAEDAE